MSGKKMREITSMRFDLVGNFASQIWQKFLRFSGFGRRPSAKFTSRFYAPFSATGSKICGRR